MSKDRQFACLTYHVVGDGRSQCTVSIEQFESHLAFLEAMGLPGVVNRVNVRRHFSMHDFQRILEGNRGFYLWRQARATALMIPKQVLR